MYAKRCCAFDVAPFDGDRLSRNAQQDRILHAEAKGRGMQSDDAAVAMSEYCVQATRPSLIGPPRKPLSSDPSLSTSGETLTIEESMNLEGENGATPEMLESSTNGARAADEALPPAAKTREA